MNNKQYCEGCKQWLEDADWVEDDRKDNGLTCLECVEAEIDYNESIDADNWREE